MAAAPENMKFEAAMDELEKLVSQLEKGDLPLEKALEAFEKGTALVRHCQTKLQQADLRVEKVVAAEGAAPRLEPLTEG
jgi:exodeoxyribonuclease VII small subunit